MNVGINRDLRKRKSREVGGILSLKTTIVLVIAVAVGLLVYTKSAPYLGEYNIHVACGCAGLIIAVFEANIMGLPFLTFIFTSFIEMSQATVFPWVSAFRVTKETVLESYPDVDVSVYEDEQAGTPEASKQKKKHKK